MSVPLTSSNPLSDSVLISDIETGHQIGREIAEHHSDKEKQNAKANQLSSLVDRKLRDLSPTAPTGNIFKVHGPLRNVNAKAYEPDILAIGPYHRGKKHLIAMEKQKLRYLKQLLAREGESNRNKYVSEMWNLKGEARACYADPVHLKDDEFVEMMLLDACFIVELLRKYLAADLREIDDTVLRTDYMCSSLARDLLLVENQLPFFILEKFHEMTKGPDKESLCEKILGYFQEVTPKLLPKHKGSNIQSANHVLGLLHKRWTTHNHSEMCSMDLKDENNSLLDKRSEMSSIRCATQLREAGIKFKKADSADNMFAVTFVNGTMEVPYLQINDYSESFFRNLVAYEQESPELTVKHFSDYVRLMDNLLNTSKDVELFCECGIIDNLLGDYEVVAKMFNRLCDNVVLSRHYEYEKLFGEVNEHCSRRWNQWKANLWHNYFNTPWALISFFAAVLLLLLTVTQTVFTVLPYVDPK